MGNQEKRITTKRERQKTSKKILENSLLKCEIFFIINKKNEEEFIMPQTLKLRFNEIVKERFTKEFDTKKVDIEDDLAYIKNDRDGAFVDHTYEVLRCKKIKAIKLSALNAEDTIYVRNGIILPEDDYDIPLFTYDLVEASSRMFSTIDIVPLLKNEEYNKRYVLPMKPITDKYNDIPRIEGAKQDISEWGKEFESGQKLYIRCAKEYEPKIEEAFNEYLDLYISFIKNAEPINDENAKKEMANLKERYKKAYHENDPGVGPMTIFFGKEWAEKFFEEFPF
ncbi:MAG: hypothetical protein D6734_00330 [Candidatus Schekmanbacteria bacterium]|nr:MAG: hypothetical protein D6734_00330 [Candidatus Schekmanbacteria bacterium]